MPGHSFVYFNFTISVNGLIKCASFCSQLVTTRGFCKQNGCFRLPALKVEIVYCTRNSADRTYSSLGNWKIKNNEEWNSLRKYYGSFAKVLNNVLKWKSNFVVFLFYFSNSKILLLFYVFAWSTTQTNQYLYSLYYRYLHELSSYGRLATCFSESILKPSKLIITCFYSFTLFTEKSTKA